MSATFKCSWCEEPFYEQLDGTEAFLALELPGNYHFGNLSCMVRFLVNRRWFRDVEIQETIKHVNTEEVLVLLPERVAST